MIAALFRIGWGSVMPLPLQVIFRNMEASPAVEASVRQRASAFERYFPRITACRVMVEAGHRQHQKGKLYRAGRLLRR